MKLVLVGAFGVILSGFTFACAANIGEGADEAASAATRNGAGDAGDAPDASGDAAQPDGDSATTVTVDVGGSDGRSFEPKDVTIRVGSTVHWKWTMGRHNVVSGTVQDDVATPDGKFCNGDDASCEDAPVVRPPSAYDHTFTTAGDYPYFCAPHADMGMVGVVHVIP